MFVLSPVVCSNLKLCQTRLVLTLEGSESAHYGHLVRDSPF